MQKVCRSVYIYLQVVIFDSLTSRAEFPKPKEVGRFKEMEKSTNRTLNSIDYLQKMSSYAHGCANRREHIFGTLADQSIGNLIALILENFGQGIPLKGFH